VLIACTSRTWPHLSQATLCQFPRAPCWILGRPQWRQTWGTGFTGSRTLLALISTLFVLPFPLYRFLPGRLRAVDPFVQLIAVPLILLVGGCRPPKTHFPPGSQQSQIMYNKIGIK